MPQDTRFHLIPAPKKIVQHKGSFAIDRSGTLCIDDRALFGPMRIARKRHLDTLAIVVNEPAHAQITLRRGARLGREGYRLHIQPQGIFIEYAAPAGAFYAMMTLDQMLDVSPAVLPCMDIWDAPTFANRGYMLDIGRNKVPKTQEILQLVERLAALKINHLELYIEGVPFCYKSFPNMYDGRDLLTGEDILTIDAWCRERFIELVPTQNNFGHMPKWLKEQYNYLAECPEGFPFEGGHWGPHCLDPQDPGSLQLVTQLADDLLPYFSSGKYNVCCDETLELGQGKSKAACEERGKGRVYLEFLLKIYDICRKHGKQMLFWNDIIKHYPELLPLLPKDVIALEWGYSPVHPTAESCEAMQRSGVPYYVCPGTGAWNSLLGRSTQMRQNIDTAATNGVRYGAIGLLNTDWGDCGHLQSIAVSYPGISYGAAMSWGPDENRGIDLAAALNAHVYYDPTGRMADFALAIGDAYLQEPPLHNITYSFRTLLNGLGTTELVKGLTDEDLERVPRYIDSLLPMLDEADPHCADAALLAPEYRLAARQIKAAALIGQYNLTLLRAAEGAPADTARQRRLLERLAGEMEVIMRETKVLWLRRNRYSYLDESVDDLFGALYRSAQKALAALDGPAA